MHLSHYLALLMRSERELAGALRAVAEFHRAEADVATLGSLLADECDLHADRLKPIADRYRADEPDPPEGLHSDLFHGPRDGPLGLLRDLHDLYLMTCECDLTWTLVSQAAQGARDTDLLGVVRDCEGESATQAQWLKSRMKQAAPQALVVA